MTAEKMTLAEALDVALGWDSRSSDFDESTQARAVLRAFRERGLPLFEAAEKIGGQRAWMDYKNPAEYRVFVAAMDALAAELADTEE